MRGSRLQLPLLALVLPLLGLLVMVMAMLIPDRLVMDRLHDATVNRTMTVDNYEVGLTGSRTDRFSECKRLTIGLGALPGDGFFDSAVRNPTLGPCDLAVPKIEGWAQGDGLTRAYNYFRYWNGSTAVLRPSVALLGLAGTRMLVAAALVAALGAFWLQLSRRVGRLAASFAIIPLVATTDFVDLPGALVHALGMLATLISVTLLLRFLRSDSSLTVFAGAAFTSGAASLFVGDLTNPDAAWALAASTSAVIVAASPLRPAAVRVLVSTGSWITGFAWMWFTKWLIAVPVVGYETVRYVVTTQAEERLSGEADGDSGALFGSVSRAYDSWRAQPLMATVLVVSALAAIAVLLRRGDIADTWRRRALIAAPAVIPIAWHLVMRQHTFIHSWFTYRSFAAAAGIALLALTARIGAGADGVDRRTTTSTPAAAAETEPSTTDADQAGAVVDV